MRKYHDLSRSLLALVIAGLLLSGGARGQAAEPGEAKAEPPVKKSALWYLQHASKPVFRKGSELIPLTRWGWSMTGPVKLALTEDYGYALMLPKPKAATIAKQLADPKSQMSRFCALAASNPQRYPLAVLVPRTIRGVDKPESVWVHDAQGKRFDAKSWKTWSPEAPDSIYHQAAERMVAALQPIKERAPVAILLNGGEYGLTVLGHGKKYWSQDPKVLAAKGDQNWFSYISKRKAHREMIITHAVRKLFPDRKLYLWYHYGTMPGLLSPRWTYDYKYMKSVADMPGQSLYFKHGNSGWAGKGDLLTNFLASVALASKQGQPRSYNWVCAGWKKDQFSDRNRYMGFLKCLYTAGQVGAVAGYFAYPEPGFKADDLGEEMPGWLWQMVDLGRAQALFSHVDQFIMEGDLLPGDGPHRRDDTIPAYEFETGDPNARVLARKLHGKEQWLVTAWAAAGDARDVSVFIPDLGNITVHARPSGSVYLATPKVQIPYEPPSPHLKLLDADGMHPSAGFAKREP